MCKDPPLCYFAHYFLSPHPIILSACLPSDLTCNTTSSRELSLSLLTNLVDSAQAPILPKAQLTVIVYYSSPGACKFPMKGALSSQLTTMSLRPSTVPGPWGILEGKNTAIRSHEVKCTMRVPASSLRDLRSYMALPLPSAVVPPLNPKTSRNHVSCVT